MGYANKTMGISSPSKPVMEIGMEKPYYKSTSTTYDITTHATPSSSLDACIHIHPS
jgi:hypothetical protein